jgi:hypothetical protein
MTEPKRIARDRAVLASMGGAARAEALTAGRRSEIARDGALSRWNLPKALAEGVLEIAGRPIACAVIETKLRLLTQETFLTAIGRAAKAKGGKGSERMAQFGGLPPFLAVENLQPFISDDLRRAATPIVFRTLKGNKAYGYDAKLLPLVCEVYLLARDAHLAALKDAQERRVKGENVEAKLVLLPTQERLVQACDLLMRGMAKEHIVTLVDRATGYHDQEVRDELARILKDYIAPHLMPYFERFPNEFFRQVYRIHGWEYEIGNNRRPQYVGHFINQYIYGELPEGILPRLQELNPVTEAGYRKTQNHRLLTDTGIIHLDRQITSTITVMALSEDKEDFKRQFAKHKMRSLPGSAAKTLVLPAPAPMKQVSLFPLLDLATRPKEGVARR